MIEPTRTERILHHMYSTFPRDAFHFLCRFFSAFFDLMLRYHNDINDQKCYVFSVSQFFAALSASSINPHQTFCRIFSLSSRGLNVSDRFSRNAHSISHFQLSSRSMD